MELRVTLRTTSITWMISEYCTQLATTSSSTTLMRRNNNTYQVTNNHKLISIGVEGSEGISALAVS
jgi:hypothetical protein